MQRLRVVIAASLILSAGCGSITPQGTAPVKASPTPSATSEAAAEPTHQITVGDLSVTVPKDWTEGKQVRVSQTSVFSEYGYYALLPKTTPDSGQGIINDALNKSPFASEQLLVHSGQVDLNLTEVSATGKFYVLNITVPASDLSEVNTVAASIKTPPVATATDIVRFMEEGAQKGQVMSAARAQVGPSRWILISGNPATAQEEFALYRSRDGGKTWSLATWTTFQGTNDFMGLVGGPDMFFWTQTDGVIVESSLFLTDQLLIYRTKDGGSTWTSMRLATPGQPKSTTVSREANGDLLLEVPLTSGKVYQTTSADGGMTWSK